MIETLYTACSVVASGVQTATDILRFIYDLNYDLVDAVVGAASVALSSLLSAAQQIQTCFFSCYSCVANVVMSMYEVVNSVVQGCWKFVVVSHNCYLSVCMYSRKTVTSVNDFVCFLSTASKNAAMAVTDFFANSADISRKAVCDGVSSLVLLSTLVGKCCVNIVTGIWQGLGYVLYNVSLFPAFIFECLGVGWRFAMEALYRLLTSVSKETYLGIILLCLAYLISTNTMRYFCCRSYSIFPRRRRRRSLPFHIDRNFESDYEDLYVSDDERLVRQIHTMVPDQDDDHSDSDHEQVDDHRGFADDNSDFSDDDDDSDDNVDSDEYTVITEEESDSDTSLNSQTFSNESSDHEIDVLLPSVDEHYNLRSRASTPSCAQKPVANPEDFDREMERERDKRKCVVCQDQVKSVLVMPCRHMCLCVLCADQIVHSRSSGRRVCPLCRTKMEKVMNVYV